MNIRPLSTAELRRWREGKDLVRSPIVSPQSEPERVERRPAPKPLDPRSTYEVMKAEMLAAVKKDRGSYEQAKRWLRVTTPGFANMSDSEIERQLDDVMVERLLDRKIRESVTRVTTDRGIMRPVEV